jgi:hypothetical protein
VNTLALPSIRLANSGYRLSRAKVELNTHVPPPLTLSNFDAVPSGSEPQSPDQAL